MMDYVDGVEIDYPNDFELDAGYIQCALSSHMIQREVDEFGEPVKVVQRTDSIGRPIFDEKTRQPLYVKASPRAGMCEACFIESRSGEYISCRAHGNQRRVENVEGCPLCAAGSEAIARLDARDRAVDEPESEDELRRSEEEVRAQHRPVVVEGAAAGASEHGVLLLAGDGAQSEKPGGSALGNRKGVRSA
ncbi:MAG: hypothetical protein ACKVW3_01935 [Phycisphaerales bacterium]